MRKLLYFLPFHFTLCLILGICIQYFFKIWIFGFQNILVIHLLFLGMLFFLHHKKAVTFLCSLYFFLAGVFLVFVNDDVNYSNYYRHFLQDHSTVVVKIDKVLKSSSYHDKYQAKIIQVDTIKTRGVVLLNITKDSLLSTFKVDELVLTNVPLQKINTPLNPNQFNYKEYLKKQGIHQQMYLEKHQFKRLGFGSITLNGVSEQFRDFVKISLDKQHFSNDELAVMNALLLGQRNEISKELLNDYSKAGAIHILAVSGLHVGIILMLLQTLFKFFERFKHGKIVKTLLIIFILWMFAFVAGLSASVVRAVTMFTFLAIGQHLGSKRIILFSLFSSMCFLLIFKPLFLFDVGFQLSYLAVLGIITIQSKLYKVILFKNYFLNKIWQLTSVSMAAQVGVLPLSLFYFHQFPGLFFLSNIVIIPFLGVILMAGIAVIFLSVLEILPPFFAVVYELIIRFMNSFVNWISNQEAFLFKDISLSFWLMLASYICLFFVVRFLLHQTAKKLLLVLISFVFFQGVFLWERTQTHQKKEFIVFHKSKNTVLGFRDKSKFNVIHNSDSLQAINSIIESYKIGENVKESYKKLNSTFFIEQNQQILMIDSLGIYQLKNLTNPIVILQNSPKINIERMIKTLQPKQIIADGSNYTSYVNRWGIACENLQVPFHYTGEKGAFVLKY